MRLQRCRDAAQIFLAILMSKDIFAVKPSKNAENVFTELAVSCVYLDTADRLPKLDTEEQDGSAKASTLATEKERTESVDDVWQEMYKAARNVRRKRRVSRYVDAGAVGAAVQSASGKIYLGVCVDTCCTLGICAERNAMFQMITAGEDAIQKVVAVGGDGKILPPCGACREFIVQLMPDTYKEVEVLLEGKQGPRVVTMTMLAPDWWIRPI